MRKLKDILIVVLLMVLVGMTYVQEGDIMDLHRKSFQLNSGWYELVNEIIAHENRLEKTEGGYAALEHWVDSIEGGLVLLNGGLAILKGGLDSQESKLAALKGGLDKMNGGLDLRPYFAASCTLRVEILDERGFFMGPGAGPGPGPQSPKTTFTGGSGVFVSDNILLTAKHVIENRLKDSSVTITAADGNEYLAIKVLEDVDDDLALVIIEDRTGPALELGPRPSIGDDLICIGAPVGSSDPEFNRQCIISWGRVSSEKFENYFLYDGFVWHGCSGGPIIHDGKLVGIVNARLNGCDSLGFSAPITRLDPDLRNRF